MIGVVMALAQRPDGADVARCGEHVAISRHGAAMALARRTGAGVPDQPWQAERNGVPVMRGPSLHRLARLTCIETPGGQRGFGPFNKPMAGVGENAVSLPGVASPEPVRPPAGAMILAEADEPLAARIRGEPAL